MKTTLKKILVLSLWIIFGCATTKPVSSLDLVEVHQIGNDVTENELGEETLDVTYSATIYLGDFGSEVIEHEQDQVDDKSTLAKIDSEMSFDNGIYLDPSPATCFPDTTNEVELDRAHRELRVSWVSILIIALLVAVIYKLGRHRP